MVEREGETSKRLRQLLSRGLIVTSGALLQKLGCALRSEHVERQLGRAAAPIRPAGGDEKLGARGWHKIAQHIGRLDVVVDEQERLGEREMWPRPARATFS